jgi:hypothetical protein
MVEWLKEKALSFNSSTTKKKKKKKKEKNRSFEPKAQTPGIPYASSGHLYLYTK